MRRLALSGLSLTVAIALGGCAILGALTGSSSSSPAPTGGTPGTRAPTATPAPSAAASATADTPPTIATDVRVIDRGDRGSYGVVTLPLEDWDVRVDWPRDPDGTDLAEYLDAHPGIGALTNAGIFSEDLTPGGLLVADGEELRSLNLADGYGNFHLKPNAVFEIREDGTAAIVESSAYTGDGVVQATQSGPALLLDGEVHPEFRDGSVNTAFRSGVGVSPDGRTVFLAITRTYVNLWDFATMFRDELGVEDAMYLDGQISQLWVSGDAEPTPFLGPYAGVIAAYPR